MAITNTWSFPNFETDSNNKVKTIKEKFNATSIDNSIKINKQTKGD